MAIVSLILSVIAILVAAVSIVYVRRQAIEATSTRAIEQSRWHADLTPVLKITCQGHEPDGNRADLSLELTGPAALAGLDEVIIKIRDDMPGRQARPGSQITQEQMSEVIWGPYRIVTGLKDTDDNGRAHGPFRLPKNEPYPIPLERSHPPSWVSDPGWWRRQYEERPVRLEITGKRKEGESWVIPHEVGITYPPFIL